MKLSNMIRLLVLSAGAAIAMAAAPAAHAQTPLSTAFTYQGELASAGTPATGSYDIRFRLFDAASGGNQIGGTLCSDNLAVSAGRFGASLDFGGVFTGQKRFLEIEVRQDAGLDCSDASGYTVLSPRQELTAAPNATYSLTATNASSAATLGGQPAAYFSNAANLTGTVPSAGLAGPYANALTLSNPANLFAGNGAAITNLSATNISAGVLDAARMPTNWAAGGDLSGFFPSPTINAGAVTLSKLSPSVQGTLSKLSNLTPAPTPLDAVAFGANNRGQINVAALPPGVKYVAIAGGNSQSIALRSDGMVVGWGFNGNGQLNVPALPPGVTYTAVATGNEQSLAVRSDGTVVGWGGNGFGQVTVPALPANVTYTAVAAGFYHSLALRSDGTVAAFGDNGYGQLSVPALPPGIRYVAVAAGDFHSLALRSDGTVVAWGANYSGQLNVQARPPGVTFTAIECGGNYSLALRSDGLVAAWGENQQGQLNVPNLPPGLTYTAVAGGDQHSLALRSDGMVVGWGYNASGQTNVPGLLPDLTYTAVAAGTSHSLALRATTVAPSLGSTVGLSIGSTTPPPAIGGISVAGASSFAAGVSAASFAGSGASLTNLNASNISAGTLANAQTTGTSLSTPSTLVLRDGSGSFSAGTITASAFTGSGGGLTGLSASNLTAGTLGDGLLSGNIPRLNVNNTFAGDTQTFAGRIRVNNGIIQKGGSIFPGADLGLYTFTAGEWMRFATNNGAFQWFSDNGTNPGGLNARMTLTGAGNLSVVGSLSKGGGSFKIDHPLDPENKYLYHSFVESPDMMNIYNGNVTTDASGYAVITLPDYFEALNRDFRYQLTVLDDSENDFILAKVYCKIGVDAPRQFTIKSSMPNIEVSWQVTGIRQDAWAQKNRIPNSIDKPAAEKGTLLHPEAFGKPASPAAADLQPATR